MAYVPMLRIAPAVAALALTLTAYRPADAATITLGAACSLAQAIESANTNTGVAGCASGAAGLDRIIVAPNVLLSTVDNTSSNGPNGLPIVTEDLRITSPDPAVTSFITRDYAVGTPEFRILQIGDGNAAPAVTISRIYMQNGRVGGSIPPLGIPTPGAGGCILLRSGSLTIVDSVMQECAAVGVDNAAGLPAGAQGGAVSAAGGTLVIRDSSFSLNTVIGGEALAAGDPGGAAQGGAVFAASLDSFVVANSDFNSNFVTGGAGVSTGGVASGGGLVFNGVAGTIRGSTFSANAATGGGAASGDAGLARGGGIVIGGGATLTLTDSEVTFNVVSGQPSASRTGGYAYGAGVHASGSTLTVGGSDISDNRAAGGQGQSAAFNGLARGGGLYLDDTSATLDDVRIEANSLSGAKPQGAGVAVYHGGSVATPTLITNATIADNVAVASVHAAEGGAIYQEGDTVTVRNTTIADNIADVGAGLFQESGTAVLSRSTLSSNQAATHGGAVAMEASLGFPLPGHTVELADVTVSGNTAGTAGGGLYVVGAPSPPDAATLVLDNTTVTNNSNGGIHLVHTRTDPVLEAGNSIVGAQASGADCTVDGSAVLTSNGGNLESGTDCTFTAATDQQSVAELGLAPIGDYGGETATHDLLPGSPAIDAGRRRPCRQQAGGRDQRGLARFYDGDGDRDFDCDSGAVEFQGLLANPGFEQRLSAADWSLVASGGGDGRARLPTAPSGRFVAVLEANGAAETLSQTVPISGDAGETYALTLLALGSGLTVEAFDVTLATRSGGAPVDSETCTTAFPAADFVRPLPLCELATTAAYDALDVTLGWTGATTGSLSLDAVSLIRR